MKISGQQFFNKFVELFQFEFNNNPGDILSKYRDNTLWTNFMLKNKPIPFVSKVVTQLGHMELHLEPEFYNFDICVWDKGNFEDNKPEYKQPLYLHVTIEHENGPNPEKEFWKLLHWYSPLKILICYPNDPVEMIKYFVRIKNKVNTFLPRSPTEEYLIIFGRLSSNMNRDEIQWDAWVCRSNEAEFSKIK